MAHNDRAHGHPDDHDHDDDHDDGDGLGDTGGSFGDLECFDLVTIGIDVGSSTSHFAMSRLQLTRMGSSLSSRYVVTEREELWRSPVLLTPYLDEGRRIDVDALRRFVADGEQESGISLERIDTGAVLLTGTALERENAFAVAEAVARDAGRFVCAAAGHHLEAELAAHGSGAVELSARTGKPVLAVDVGGGTAKFARCEAGSIVATGALGVGGRLVAFDAERHLVRLEHSAELFAANLGVALTHGEVLSDELGGRLAERMAEVLVGAICGDEPDELTRQLWLTEWPEPSAVGLVSFSGGVAEYLDGGEQRDFGDLGGPLALAIARRLSSRSDAPELVIAAQRIRATVIGASQYSTQVSGSTVVVSARALPVHGVPVVRVDVELGVSPDPTAISAALVRGITARSEAIELAGSCAVAIAWSGVPTYARLRAIADGIAAAVHTSVVAQSRLLVVVLDSDLGASLGRVLREDAGLTSPEVIALDSLELGNMDYLDLAVPREPSGVVPVVVKSLLFSKASATVSRRTQAESSGTSSRRYVSPSRSPRR